MRLQDQPIGVILAGGRGVRMGGGKVTVELRGKPLISYPLAAMRSVLSEVAVITKATTDLPPLAEVMVWIEPDKPVHPLLGIGEALELAGGRPVLVCPADLPLLDAKVLRRLLETKRVGAPAVVASCGGELEPLLGCYWPEAAQRLAEAAYSGQAARQAIKALGPVIVEIEDRRSLFNVNSPDELLQAAAMLDQPNVKS